MSIIMKKMLILIMLIMQSNGIYAQSTTDIFLIGTSSSIPGTYKGIFNGFGKYSETKKNYTKVGGITYSIGSIAKEYEVFLLHVNYTNSKKPDKVIVDRPLSDLKYYAIIDIETFIATKSRSQIWKWMIDNKDKKVWIIDRNDFYKSSADLKSVDRMKMIQTEIWIDNIPDHVLNPQ